MKQILLLVVGLIVVAAPKLVHAEPPKCEQSIFVPVDIREGATFGRGLPRPYAFGANPAFLFGFGDCGTVRIGPAAAISYLNPKWSVSGGLHLAFRLFSLVEDLGELGELSELGLYLEVEGRYGTQDSLPIDGLLALNLAGFARVGVWTSYDVNKETSAVGALLGFELTSWFGGGEEDFPDGDDNGGPSFGNGEEDVTIPSRLAEEGQTDGARETTGGGEQEADVEEQDDDLQDDGQPNDDLQDDDQQNDDQQDDDQQNDDQQDDEQGESEDQRKDEMDDGPSFGPG